MSDRIINHLKLLKSRKKTFSYLVISMLRHQNARFITQPLMNFMTPKLDVYSASSASCLSNGK